MFIGPFINIAVCLIYKPNYVCFPLMLGKFKKVASLSCWKLKVNNLLLLKAEGKTTKNYTVFLSKIY